MRQLIDRLAERHSLDKTEYLVLLEGQDAALREYAAERARAVRHRTYGRDVYIRGLIEFTNYCKNNCFYCGIRRDNKNAERYRLTRDDILDCCETGYGLGFRTFVLQGGEDPFYTDSKMADIISAVKRKFPDCALTLSLGERSRESYELFHRAGADRYLLRHETADPVHYGKIHPPELDLENRKRCLWDLKEIGFQVGSGFMVGSPYQTNACLAEDLLFLKELDPQMVGIGPFIPHRETPFAQEKAGSLELTLFLLSLVRLMLPNALIPATTALGTVHPEGRELGILAGANVVMPNLSPKDVRKKYLLYDNKICTGDEAAECRLCLEERINKIGYRIPVSRGDYRMGKKEL